MTTFIQLTKYISDKNRFFLENYEYFANKINEFVKSKYHEAKVFVFGSVVKGKFNLSSDIDILIYIPGATENERKTIYSEVFREFFYVLPLEIHVAGEKEFLLYEKFIDKRKEVK